MTELSNPPRLLGEVLQAINELKERGGSNLNKICEYMNGTIIPRNNIQQQPRDVGLQVKKALKLGLDSGIISHRDGKYRLETGRISSKLIGEPSDYNRRRRHKRKRRRQRQTRRRRRELSTPNSETSNATSLASNPSKASVSQTESFTLPASGSESSISKNGGKKKNETGHEANPEDRGRRRRRSRERRRRRQNRRGQQERRRRRIGRRVKNSQPLNENQNESKEDNPVSNIEGNDHNGHDGPNCGNPDCLCNVKQEDGGQNIGEN